MSGVPITLASSDYTSPGPYSNYGGNNVHVYNGKNSYRLPAYHRADVSLNTKKQVSRGLRTLSFSIYNVYNRQNPFFVFYKTDGYYSANPKINLYQISLFPIIPSISYTLDF